MLYRSVLLAAVAAGAVTSTLQADPLKPIQAQKVELGALTGVAYYTVEPNGYRLVATLQMGETNAPFRFIATLAPGQAVTLSVARNAGKPAAEVHFLRDGEQLLINGGGALPLREASSQEFLAARRAAQ